ncbi:hypothetical protein ACFQGT_03760 [Natrialbaceae archaeon GCM10025810]|uniref:hypothetical protein n=1 Tax=Halovalidus salilacus TaxID=3075124 RepID=UPI00360AABCE
MATVETVLSSIFDTIPELHSGQLGLLAGLLVGILYWHGYRRSSLGLLTAVYLLALGVVPAYGRGLLVVQAKPWYFCSLLIATALLAIGGHAARSWVASANRSRSLSVTRARERRGSGP